MGRFAALAAMLVLAGCADPDARTADAIAEPADAVDPDPSTAIDDFLQSEAYYNYGTRRFEILQDVPFIDDRALRCAVAVDLDVAGIDTMTERGLSQDLELTARIVALEGIGKPSEFDGVIHFPSRADCKDAARQAARYLSGVGTRSGDSVTVLERDAALTAYCRASGVQYGGQGLPDQPCL